MDRKSIIKKKRILSHISQKQYRELLTFVEELYLADYSLKILAARKGSNLFDALIDLVKEEDGGRVQRLYEQKFAQTTEPIIVSDRALDYYAEDIKNGRYKTILIGDDTVRHGKTIKGLHDKIKGMLSEYSDESKVELRAFAVCQEKVAGKNRIDGWNIQHYVSEGEYLAISDMVIDVLYLAGQPYTSYVPNIVIQKESPLYQKIINQMQTLPEGFPDGEEQKKLKCRAAIWIAPETPQFAMFQSMRFYRNDDLEQCTLVPMVSLKPISDESLFKYGGILKEFIQDKYYGKVFFQCRELSYRTIIYVVSSLFLRQYIREELQWNEELGDLENPQEEKLNFGDGLLNQQRLNQMKVQEISDILNELDAAYEEVDQEKIWQLDAAVETLGPEVADRILQSSMRQATTGELVREFFSISGDWNESRWQEISDKEDNMQECVNDYPLICLAHQIGIEKRDRCDFYTQILKAVDYGSGSIVDSEKKKDGKSYYLPLLNAGERNYKYKLLKHFPFLYGLFEIEQKAAQKKVDSEYYKIKFFTEFARTADIHEKTDLEKLCNINISARYKLVLLKDAWSYPNKGELSRSIALADKIMQ